MIPYEIIKELVVSGVKFSYVSYDHKKAVAELTEIESKKSVSTTRNINNLEMTCCNCWGIPDELKDKYLVWRVGRIHSIHFNFMNQMEKFKIGRYYFKNFHIGDFGIRVKPILFKSEDKYDLISQGLAVENTM